MDKVSQRGTKKNKSFSNFIKPFMANKGMITSNNKNIITDEYETSQTINKYYINIVEKNCENKPNNISI